MKLFVQRICADWDRSPPNLRKALVYKEALSVHTACGMYLYYMEAMQRRCPANSFASIKPKLHESFMAGLMDGELISSAENTVPPGDPCTVSAFRTTNFTDVCCSRLYFVCGSFLPLILVSCASPLLLPSSVLFFSGLFTSGPFCLCLRLNSYNSLLP